MRPTLMFYTTSRCPNHIEKITEAIRECKFAPDVKHMRNEDFTSTIQVTENVLLLSKCGVQEPRYFQN